MAGAVRAGRERVDDEPGDRRARLDAKKKSLRASERDEAARAAWRAEAAALAPADLVLLDETGSHLGYTPTHARAPRGRRAYASAPATRGARTRR